MDAKQPQEKNNEASSQAADPDTEVSDVDFNHVRGLMYALITICVFCASILLGPDEQILPADGELKLPIVDLTISQGSFLYFGPIIIICVSIYTYLFLLKILADVKAGREDSDQYIFTMQSPAAQVATYLIFFWLPAIVLFAFAYKALPRPESANLLGVALIFLIFVVAIQLSLRLYRSSFLGVISASIFCVALIMLGLTERGWLKTVRLELHALRSIALEKVDLKARDLRNVDIRNAQAALIELKGADLRGATLREANLENADLGEADLRNARLTCTDLTGANLFNANLGDAQLPLIRLRKADLREANLAFASFYAADTEQRCSDESLVRSDLTYTRLDKADLSRANLSNVSLGFSTLDGARLFRARLIRARAQSASFRELDGESADLTSADLRCAGLQAAKMDLAIMKKAELDGANLTKASLAGADLVAADFDPLCCSEKCTRSYIEHGNGNGDDGAAQACECAADEEVRAAQLVKTNLSGSDLSQASFTGANLREADLRGAKLIGTDLSGSILDDSNLLLARLAGTIGLTCEQLTQATNWRAAIRDDALECGQASLNFEKPEDVKIGDYRKSFAGFQGLLEEFARYSRADRRRSNDGSRSFDTYDKMANARMTGINLERFDLEGIWLRGAVLERANLTGTILKDANLSGAKLESARMLTVNLRGAVLDGADLQKAILHNARLEKARLKGVKLNDADLRGARLNGVKGLTCKQLTSAINWRTTSRDKDLDCDA